MNQQTYFKFAKIDEPQTWLIVGLVMVVIAIFVRLVYRRDGAEMPGWMSWFNTLLRVGALVLLCWVFLEPERRVEETIVRQARTLMLFDVSQSMNIRDRKGTESAGETGPSRYEQLVEALGKTDLTAGLSMRNDVSVYRFGRSLESLATLAREAKPETKTENQKIDWKHSLDPSADETRLGEVLSNLLQRETTAPIAGVAVFSDGRLNAGITTESAIELARKRGIPIHVIPLGGLERPRNLRMNRLQSPTHTYPKDSFSLQAYLQGTGFSGKTINVELLRKPDAEGTEAQSLEVREVIIEKDNEPVAVTFTQTLEDAGRFLYTIRIEQQEGELVKEDNEQSAWVQVVDRKAKVLILAGGPTREYRYARMVLHRDKSINLSVFLQNMEEGGNQESDEQLMEFPEPEKLYEFDALIAFDADFGALTEDHRESLNQWLFKEGGGLVFFAGLHNTPRLAREKEFSKIRELLPVIFGSDLELVEMIDREATDAWPLEFTEEGKSSEAIRLSDEAVLSQTAWETFKGVYRCFPVSGEKPGATALANFSDPRAQFISGKAVYMAEQFFGSGRSLYFGSGELWRLRKLDPQFYERFWVGMIRHISQGRLLRGSQKGFLMVDRDTFTVGSSVRVRAQLRDSQLKPLLAQQVPLNVVSPNGTITEVILAPEEGRPGWFRSEWRVRETGIYRMQLLVPGTKDRVDKSITAIAPNLEFEDPRRNDPLLDELAEKTGGQRFELDHLEELIRAIPNRSEEEIVSRVPIKLWDKEWVMYLAAILLSLEWLIRKLKNLA
ncbi:MAG: hypothetical protein O3B01_18995 [Planctomycetota bacterium]|nr:hypothetical protein [Planctomycetota bacterium]MDA1140660.1 hypothetical protein [Planctomycetota bacterium]